MNTLLIPNGLLKSGQSHILTIDSCFPLHSTAPVPTLWSGAASRTTCFHSPCLGTLCSPPSGSTCQTHTQCRASWALPHCPYILRKGISCNLPVGRYDFGIFLSFFFFSDTNAGISNTCCVNEQDSSHEESKWLRSKPGGENSSLKSLRDLYMSRSFWYLPIFLFPKLPKYTSKQIPIQIFFQILKTFVLL